MTSNLPAVLTDRLRLPVIAAPMFEALAKHDANHPESPAAPFAVNLSLRKGNERLEADLALVAEFRVPIVITSLGARADVNERVHTFGGIVLHDVINYRFARKAIDKGADGLIAVCAGAGGHGGAQSPFALVQEIRAWFSEPVALGGAVANRGAVLAALACGADLAYAGSLFIATEEASAVPAYKRMVVESSADDIVYTDHFTGIRANYLRGSIEAAGMDPANLPPDAGPPEDVKPWRDIWGAGQGIAAADAVRPVAAVVDRLAAEYTAARARLRLGTP